MFKYRRTASMLLGGVSLALTSIVGLGGPAQAATGAEILVPISFSASGTYKLPRTFTAGDCRQVGQNQSDAYVPSRLEIKKSDTVQDHYLIVWSGTLYTVSTHRWDVWHAKFTFRSSAGPLFSLVFEGPIMQAGFTYNGGGTANVALSADQASQIQFVDWIGDC